MSILDLYLHQTAEIEVKSGFDLYGKPTQGESVVIKCRFQEVTKTTKDGNGNLIGIDGEIWVKPNVSIGIDDTIIVESKKYRVVKVGTKRGLDGKPDHIKGFVAYIAA